MSSAKTQPLHLVHKAWYHAAHRLSGICGTLRARIQLSLTGCSIPSPLRVHGPIHLYLSRSGSLVLGDHTAIISRPQSNLVGISQTTTFQTIGEGTIQIASHAGLSGTVISARQSIAIGHRATVGANARIYDHNFHSLDPENRKDPQKDQKDVRSQPVSIGDDVFIGANAMILKGSSIGDRCIIGAGAVVAGMTIPDDSIVVGNPGRIVS